MKIKLTKNATHKGDILPAGSVIDVADEHAGVLIDAGHAKPAADKDKSDKKDKKQENA